MFIGGNPALGIDLSALQILQYVPGTGNIPLAPAVNGVVVQNDRIIFTPAVCPLANGQYSIGIFANLKSIEGDSVDKTPVFHSFTVGLADTIAPVVVVDHAGQRRDGRGRRCRRSRSPSPARRTSPTCARRSSARRARTSSSA